MITLRLKAHHSNQVYKAILTSDLQNLSSSKSNEAVDLLVLDEEWSLYFDNKEAEKYIGVEFVFKKDGFQKTLTPDHVIYWDDENVITTDDLFDVLNF